jgi:hypothetical protein
VVVSPRSATLLEIAQERGFLAHADSARWLRCG